MINLKIITEGVTKKQNYMSDKPVAKTGLLRESRLFKAMNFCSSFGQSPNNPSFSRLSAFSFCEVSTNREMLLLLPP